MRLLDWGPALVLVAGVVLVEGAGDQRAMPLRSPLQNAVPNELEGMVGRDWAMSEAEEDVAGMSSYLLRTYGEVGEAPALQLYVGYYESQAEGRTIHSPRNCLPGAGWEAVGSGSATIVTADGPVTVNRYVVQRGQERALVLYWYQGRGRIASNEYAVKLDLLKDAALSGRSEEALVRVLVPVIDSEEDSFRAAAAFAGAVVPAIYRALPEA